MEALHNHFFYVLHCADGSYYGGYTIDLERRLQQHNEGIASKYTRTRTPVTLYYWKGYESKREAMQAEYAFKQLTRKQKDHFLWERRVECDFDTAKL